MNFRTAIGILAAAFFLLCGAACNKQTLVPHTGAPKISTDLVVGPPKIIAWLKGADIPGNADPGSTYLGRISPFSFAIGGKGYIGAGDGGPNQNMPAQDVWQYDTSTRAWTQVATWPGTAHASMASFVIGADGYVCTGIPSYIESHSFVKEVWQYDPSANQWTRKRNFPGGARSGAVGAAINGKGYLGTGTTASNEGNQDWWQYDPSTDMWTQKASLPGPARTDAVAFAPTSGNGKVFVSTGYNAPLPGLFYNDLWAYNPATDHWAQKADLPAVGRGEAVGISLPDVGVVATGLRQLCSSCGLNDCWEFNPATGAWLQLANVGGGGRLDAGSFSLGNTICIGAGQTATQTPLKDFWGLNLN